MSSFDPEYVRKQYQEKLGNPGNVNIQMLVQQSFNRQQNQQNQNGQNQTNNINNQDPQNPNLNNNNNIRDEIKGENQQEKQQDQPLFIPRFLEKLTNTFFKKTDPKMNPNEYYKQKQKELEQKQNEKKQQQQLKKQISKKQIKKDEESQLSQDVQQLQSQNLNSINSKKNLNDKQRRSASSIVFDYSSFQQNSNSRFGFTNELITSLKKGANNIMKNIPFTKNSSAISSQQGLDTENRNDQFQIPNTESDELNQNPNKPINEGVIEFETEESDRPQNQVQNNIQNILISKRNKEQHVSIIENPVQSDVPNIKNQPNQQVGYSESIEAYYADYKNNQNNNKNNTQQQPIELIEHNSDDEGQLNTIIEEKSILDQTNNNNIMNQMQQRARNLSQYDAYYNNQGTGQLDNTQKSPKNFLFDKNNNPMISLKEREPGDFLIQDNNNPNQHRRFLSAQLSSQINFNRQQSLLLPQQDSTNKLPLQPFEEESSICDQSQQSKCQQDQSSMMSCSRMDKSTNTCLVCFDKQPDSVFMDCGHGGVCYDCSLEIWKKTGECYLCRLKIVQVLQVDLKSKVYGLIKVISSTQMVQKEVDESQQSSHPPLEEILEDHLEQE